MSLPNLDRRSFLRGTLAGGAALGLGLRPAWAFDEPTGKPEPGKIGDFKISLAEWSLHKRLFENREKMAELNLDFPKMAREEFGIEGVEYVNQFFKDKAKDAAYLSDLKKRAGDQGVTNVLIMIDGEGDLSSPDKAKRDQAVENHKRWVDAAKALGCHAIRVNTGENYGPDNVAAAAEGCGPLAEYGKANQIHVICENHGGPSSNPDALLALIKAVGSDYFGTLPDFGNFPNRNHQYEIDVYQAIARMMPHAKGVSAKSYDFNDDGSEKYLDYARIMKIVTDAGYHSWVGIEYEGSRLSEPEGIQATKRLLEQLRGSQYKG
jgi:L-ribulose-5-phosphate 3-epimerase